MTTNLRIPFLACVLLTAAGAVLAPAASAHDCTAQNPREACGECWNDWPNPHRHSYADGSSYCARAITDLPRSWGACLPEDKGCYRIGDAMSLLERLLS